MRFQLNIIHLLIIGPTFLVVVAVLSVNRLPHYYWSIASKDVNRLESKIQMLREVEPTTEADPSARKISPKVIGAWLSGSMGNHHPILGECPEKDPWANPYQCVTRRVGDEDRLGVYSFGRDGTSKSDGNDKDDLNSWNDDGLKWYKNVDNRRERIDLVAQGLVFTALIYVFFLLIKGAAVAERKRHGL